MLQKSFCVILFVCPAFLLAAQFRSLNEVLPGIDEEVKKQALSRESYIHAGRAGDNPVIVPRTGTINVTKQALGNPGFFVEALRIIPGRTPPLLSIYNALQKIQGLKGKPYYSATRGRYIPLFEDAVRIEGPAQTRKFLPDPPPGESVPAGESMHIRLSDANFGHCYYTVTLQSSRQGILYRIQNFKSLSYGPIPVMRENTFIALFYIEPVAEGLLVYCLAGAEVSAFIAKYVDITSALSKRMDVITAWILDGIR